MASSSISARMSSQYFRSGLSFAYCAPVPPRYNPSAHPPLALECGGLPPLLRFHPSPPKQRADADRLSLVFLSCLSLLSFSLVFPFGRHSERSPRSARFAPRTLRRGEVRFSIARLLCDESLFNFRFRAKMFPNTHA